MLEPENPGTTENTRPDPAAEPAAVEPAETVLELDVTEPAAAPAPAKKAPRKRAAKKAAPKLAEPPEPVAEASDEPDAQPPAPATADAETDTETDAETDTETDTETEADPAAPAMAAPSVLFQPPEPVAAPPRKRARKKAPAEVVEQAETEAPEVIGEITEDVVEEIEAELDDDAREAAIDEAAVARKRRRRGRRGRGGRGGAGEDAEGDSEDEESEDAAPESSDDETAEDEIEGEAEGESGQGTSASTKRRRRRRRSSGGGSADASEDDPPNTVTHVRPGRDDDDGVKAVKGSTRLEAKRQRRRDGRDNNRRRPPILTEAEFLARREAVDRVMAVRQKGDRTQIAVLEDDVLVEHYVTRASNTSYVGNIYLGRVQNVLPSMEAAFIDISKGRNGVLYAGEVNWDAAGLEGKSRNIESALKSGDAVLVQVTKDPIGHKGARLTSQISLPGRFLVYVPGGGMTGISRKLPDTERHRLKTILKKIVPEDAGVIIRTAAEGASEEELTHDVERLQAQWEMIKSKAGQSSKAPMLIHGEPDLAIRVVRDVFNEDFKKLIVEGDAAWATVSDYVESVAPDLRERVARHVSEKDLFHELRVDEQLMKALDRKVWLPSGGSLVIDRTEAMTVIDVNTGKFVGSGGNLEQTVTRNNLEAAEEIVRQLRLRDVGGIVVIDFIDMVLESNRELVLRRLTECLGRDRTKHQVAEVTSLGLVQMTRKRVGEGLLEAFSEPCEHCRGRGVIVHAEPTEKVGNAHASLDDEERPPAKGKRKRGGGANAAKKSEAAEPVEDPEVRERRLAAMAAVHQAAHHEDGEPDVPVVEPAGALVEARSATESAAEPPEPPAEFVAAPAEPEAVPEAAPKRRRRAASRPAGPPAHVEQAR